MFGTTTTATPRHESAPDDGFTLIELLVVVVILGILIAIAIPVYLNYRKSANDKAAESDLRGTISVLELCSSDSGGTYPSAATFASGATPGVSGTVCVGRPGAVSKGSTLTYFPSADLSSYIIGSTAGSNGTGRAYCYSSVAAGAVTTTVTAIAAYRTACTP